MCHNPAVQYREHAPVAQLAAAVECIWTLEGTAFAGADPEPVFPDGRAELVMHLGDPFDLLTPAGGATRQAAILFAGQVGSSRVDLQACKLEYSIVSPK